MATTTSPYTVTSGAWTLLAENSESVLIQRQQIYPVEIFIGSASPDEGAAAVLLALDDYHLSLAGLVAEEDKVYGRAKEDDCRIVVVAQ